MKREDIIRIFSHIPTLYTERLTLRAFKVTDFEDVYRYSCDSEVSKYLLWEAHKSKSYTREYLNYIAGRYRLGDFYDWALQKNDDGRVIGMCGFTSINPQNDSAEIGYVVARDCWGNGYAAEALLAVLEFGFNVLELNRADGKYIVENAASRRVMEKCGMTYEGVLRSYMKIKGKYRDIGVCSVLKNEFDLKLK